MVSKSKREKGKKFLPCWSTVVKNVMFIRDICHYDEFAKGHARVFSWSDSTFLDLIAICKIIYWENK